MNNNIVKIVKVDGKWAIFVNGQMVEGGFFSRDAAVRTSQEYR